MRECTEELLPRTELTTHATIVLERIQTTGKPVVVMQAGNALAVVMEAEQYRQSQGNLALLWN